MKRFSLVAFAATTSVMSATLAPAALARPPLRVSTEPASLRAGPMRFATEAPPGGGFPGGCRIHARRACTSKRLGCAPPRKAPPVGGGYLTVVNQGDKPDRLIGVESDIAATVDIHEMTMSGGVMAMRPVGAPLEIAPGATLELKPGGYHVMFSELKQGVKEGDRVKATLAFEKAGKVEIEFVAGGLAATGPGTAMHKM